MDHHRSLEPSSSNIRTGATPEPMSFEDYMSLVGVRHLEARIPLTWTNATVLGKLPGDRSEWRSSMSRRSRPGYHSPCPGCMTSRGGKTLDSQMNFGQGRKRSRVCGTCACLLVRRRRPAQLYVQTRIISHPVQNEVPVVLFVIPFHSEFPWFLYPLLSETPQAFQAYVVS